jgi:hypothetical protein
MNEKIVRTQKEINQMFKELAEAYHEQQAKGSRFSGMAYEEGIDALMRWLTDEDAPHPMED